MALLIQQAAGAVTATHVYVVFTGMGCSYNPYKWMEHPNPEAGGAGQGLGTRAVERTPGDYPCLIGI